MDLNELTITETGTTDLILRAVAFAAHKHRDQRRKDKEASPYINHPIELAHVLWDEGNVRDPMVIAAALLHDTLEDTETSWQELRGEFGEEIADIVLEVTDTQWIKKEVRKRLQVAKAKHSSERARLVKLADRSAMCVTSALAPRPTGRWNASASITNGPRKWSIACAAHISNWNAALTKSTP